MTPIVYGFMTIGRRDSLFSKIYMLNPVTPIVLIFQRTIYAKLDNPGVLPTAADPKINQILPHWDMTGYLAYLGYSFVFGAVMLAIAISVFGRSEANFAEEL